MPRDDIRPEHYRAKILAEITEAVYQGYDRKEILLGLSKREGIPMSSLYRYYEKAMRGEKDKWVRKAEDIKYEVFGRMRKRAQVATRRYMKHLGEFLDGRRVDAPSPEDLRVSGQADKDLLELMLKVGILEKPADKLVVDSGDKGFKLNVVYPEGYKGPVVKSEKKGEDKK